MEQKAPARRLSQYASLVDVPDTARSTRAGATGSGSPVPAPRYAANPGLTPISGAVCRKLAVCPRVCPHGKCCANLLLPKTVKYAVSQVRSRILEQPLPVGAPIRAATVRERSFDTSP